MKSLLLIFIIFSLNEVNGAAVRKAPAFAIPKYADSFMPAVMQVIFNGVEQYKTRRMCNCGTDLAAAAASTTEKPSTTQEPATTSASLPTTISHEPGQHQPICMLCGLVTSSTTQKPLPTQEAVTALISNPTTIAQELGPHQPTMANVSSTTEKAATEEAAAASPLISAPNSHEPGQHQPICMFCGSVASSATEKPSLTSLSAAIPQEPEQVASVDPPSVIEQLPSSPETVEISTPIPPIVNHEPDQVASADESSMVEQSPSSQETTAAPIPIPAANSHELEHQHPICFLCGPVASSTTEKSPSIQEPTASPTIPAVPTQEPAESPIIPAIITQEPAASPTIPAVPTQEPAESPIIPAIITQEPAESPTIPAIITQEPEQNVSVDASPIIEQSPSSPETVAISTPIPPIVNHEPDQGASADESSMDEQSPSSQETTAAPIPIPAANSHELEQQRPICFLCGPVASSTTEKSPSVQEPTASPTIPAVPTQEPAESPIIPAIITQEPAASPTIPAVITQEPAASPTIPAIITQEPAELPTIPAIITQEPQQDASVDASPIIEQSPSSPETAAMPTSIPITISHEPGQHPPPCMLCGQGTSASASSNTEKPLWIQKTSEADNEKPSINIQSTPSNTDWKPELGAETPKATYNTPETYHETSVVSLTDKLETSTIAINHQPVPCVLCNAPPKHSSSPLSPGDEHKEATVDSVVEGIYELMKEKKDLLNHFLGMSSSSSESLEDTDEDYDVENRFAMLGEKVSQVPRPSLITYLKRVNLPSNCSTITELALLYDSLSKDARNQGFSKYTGYSDRVLKVLETSAEGGMGPQLKLLLEKIVEQRELTRADAKTKVAEILKSLNEPGSRLNRDLSLILPLHFES